MNFQKNVPSPCGKGQSKEHFQLQSFIPTGKTHDTAQLSPLSLFSWSHREHSQKSKASAFLLFQRDAIHPTSTLNLERKPKAQTPPLYKEIPKEILLDLCPWRTGAI